jgi:hypothetical protein
MTTLAYGTLRVNRFRQDFLEVLLEEERESWTSMCCPVLLEFRGVPDTGRLSLRSDIVPPGAVRFDQ